MGQVCVELLFARKTKEQKKSMAIINLQGTEFGFCLLPLRVFSRGYWARTEISVKNEYVAYRQIQEKISREEVEKLIFAMFRLLAGAYSKEYTLSFERAGLAIDFYPYTKDGEEVSREERRKNDCVMAIRLIMRSEKEAKFLDGVYSILLHRNDIEKFAVALKEEFDKIFVKFVHGKGKYLFVGVSPKGYTGCNYWYLDPSESVLQGDCVWVKMGRHNTEQVVYVDSVRYFNEEDAPFDPGTVKQVLRKATEEECKEFFK